MLTFVFLDYKSADATLGCIAHFIAKCGKAREEISFVVVDNSVDEGNFAKLSAAFPTLSASVFDGSALEEKSADGYRLFLWKSPVNGGYAKGNNAGAKIAAEFLGSDYLLFSNNDLLVLDDELSIESLVREAALPQVAIVGPSIVDKKSQPQNPYFEKPFFLRWGLEYLCYPLARFLPKSLSSDDVQTNFVSNPVFRVMGSFFVIARKKFEQADGFDPHTFLFAEEMILSHKLKKLGYETHYVPSVHLLHNHSEIIGKNYDYSRRLMLRFDSEYYYYKKYVGLGTLRLTLVRWIVKSYIVRKKLAKKIKSLFR